MISQTIECPFCKFTLTFKDALSSSVTAITCPKCHARIPLKAIDNSDNTAHIPSDSSFEVVAEESTDGSETLAAPPGPPRSTEFTFLAPPQQPDELGRLGPYRVLRKLGSGGMGAVFLAEDPALRRQLALKVMLPHFASHPVAKARFLREARAQAAVEHDHIIAIHQVGEEGGIPYIAMPLLRGLTLADALKTNPVVPLIEAVRIAREVAVGLDAAHQQNLVHRDIKPGNVWLEGRSRRVKILDFGLAQGEEDGEGTEQTTQEGTVVGTPAYMSPEQARGLPVDARTDLWSLGVMLYQMTTCELPFRGPTTGAILTALAVDNPPPPIAKNPSVPAALSDLIMRLLAKSSVDRPPTAEAVIEVLRTVRTPKSTADLSVASAVVAGSDPWESATDLDLDPVTEAMTQTVAPVPLGRSRTLPWIVVSSLLLLATLAIVVAEIVMNKLTQNSAPTIVTPQKGDVGQAAPVTVTEPPPKKPEPNLFDDRKAAAAALKQGCAVWINFGPQVRSVEELPKEPFKLTGLMFPNRQTNDADLAHFKGCQDVVFAHLNPCPQVTDVGLASFKDCKNLVLLNIGNTQVTDDGLGYFKDCPKLRILGLDCTQTGDRGLANFKDCKGLESLWLNNTLLTDVGLSNFKGCSNVVNLSLHSTKVTDEGLANFKGCKNLGNLSVGHTVVSDEGLALFKDAEKLHEMSLHNCQNVTDTALQYFQGRKSLLKIDARGTKVTEMGVKEFAESQPQCQIEWDGGVIEPKK